MTDEQTAEKNRANASHSTGPRTPDGKRRASLNANRNSLTGQIVCATPEELAIFNKFCADIRTELAPVGPVENFHAQAVAEDMFRLQRARALENGIFANGHLAHADSINAGNSQVDTALGQSKTWAEQAHNLTLLTVYEGRIRRAMEKNSAQLKALQTERKALCQNAYEQATLIAELAEARGEPYDGDDDFLPASDWGGFVFSSVEMDRRRERELRMKTAWSYRNAGRPRHPSPDWRPTTDTKAA